MPIHTIVPMNKIKQMKQLDSSALKENSGICMNNKMAGSNKLSTLLWTFYKGFVTIHIQHWLKPRHKQNLSYLSKDLMCHVS